MQASQSAKERDGESSGDDSRKRPLSSEDNETEAESEKKWAADGSSDAADNAEGRRSRRKRARVRFICF